MFYLLVMAAFICYLSGTYLALSGSLVTGIILLVLGVAITVFICLNYSRKKIVDCLDCGNDIINCNLLD